MSNAHVHPILAGVLDQICPPPEKPMVCPDCNNTGSLSKDLYGHLDCPCGIAEARVKLNDWLVVALDITTLDEQVSHWMAYYKGRTDQPEVAS